MDRTTIKQWAFRVDNKKYNLPYIPYRQYIIINQAITCNKRVEDRVKKLQDRGFEVKRCYLPTYNHTGGITYMPRLNEFRITIGRPKNHFCKEVYAVIIK
jgi:hypothetical protein